MHTGLNSFHKVVILIHLFIYLFIYFSNLMYPCQGLKQDAGSYTERTADTEIGVKLTKFYKTNNFIKLVLSVHFVEKSSKYLPVFFFLAVIASYSVKRRTKCPECISEENYFCVDLSDGERKIRVFKLKNSGNRLYQIVSEES